MAMQRRAYAEVRKEMLPGDVLAFGGKGDFSQLIKWATRAAVSHVGVVLRAEVSGDDEDRFLSLLIESTSLNGFNGVTINRTSERVETYPGEIWWLPLGATLRGMFDQKAFFDFLLEQNHKPYDLPQAVKSALDVLDDAKFGSSLTLNHEDFGKFFCSELVAAALEAAGVLHDVNASEITPIDLCMFNIFADDYVQLKGEEKQIKGFNTVVPNGWGAAVGV